MNDFVIGRCRTYDGPLCLFPYNLTEFSRYDGCFWDEDYGGFHCPTKISSNGTIEETDYCRDNCPNDCPEKMWKCNDTCISIKALCGKDCIPSKLFNLYVKKYYLY